MDVNNITTDMIPKQQNRRIYLLCTVLYAIYLVKQDVTDCIDLFSPYCVYISAYLLIDLNVFTSVISDILLLAKNLYQIIFKLFVCNECGKKKNNIGGKKGNQVSSV